MHVRTSFVGASPSFSTISAMIVALDGGPRPRTYERVAYIGVRNLPRGSLENLAAIMETTVQDAPALKFLDGVVAQGAKLRRPVHHYCLSWAPDEDPGPTEILQAVSESLVAQGLEDHQCVFFVHTNTHCIHVHLVVNRVHSDTGLAADVSRAGKILSPWARSWEERHGGVRCRRRPTPEETRAWEGLLNDQRRIDLDPEVQRLEREALARYVDECRAERGEPAAARPGRFVPRCWPRRELVLAQEEKELWAELFERHRLEDTPRHVCLQERRELAQRISEGRRVMQQAVRERAAAVDIDIDVLVDAKDAPQDAGGPRTMERWSYVQETVIPAAEGNLREIVRARLRDFPPFSVDELTAEPSSWNSQTEADSSARYRYWDNRLDFERGGRLCINADIWGDDAVAWCRQIRQKAVDAGVPNIDAYAQAEPVASQMAAGQYDRFRQGLPPHGGDPGTWLRWTYIERHVIPRWKAVRAVWNAAPRPRRRALERKPPAEAQATDQGTLGNGLVEPVWMFPPGPGVKAARDAGRTRPVEPALTGALDVTDTARPDPPVAPIRSPQIAQEPAPESVSLVESGRNFLSLLIDGYRQRKARKKEQREKRRLDAGAQSERVDRAPTAHEPTASDRDRVSAKPVHGPAEPQSVPQERKMISGEPAVKASRDPSAPPQQPLQVGGDPALGGSPQRSPGQTPGQFPGSQQQPTSTRDRKPGQGPSL